MRRASQFEGYDKIDVLFCVLAALLALWIGLCTIDSGIIWGDDWAGYLGEGIAIAKGELDDYAVRLLSLHTSELTSAMTDKIVYVWGKPLVNALVYRLIGFDTSKLLYYKIPDLICFVLIADVLFLFFRRRAGKALSFSLTFMPLGMQAVRRAINCIETDVQYMLFVFLSILLMDIYFASIGKKKQRMIGSGIFLGIALFATYATRLNGYTLLFILAIGLGVRLFGGDNRQDALIKALTPYAAFALMFAAAHFFLPMATSNISDFAKGTLADTIENYRIFDQNMANWLSVMTSVHIGRLMPVRLAVYLFMIIGMVMMGGKEELHLSTFCVGTLVVTSALPYASSVGSVGLRYYYPMLPLMPLFFAYGVTWCTDRLASLIKKNGAVLRRAMYVVFVMIACVSFVNQIRKESTEINLDDYEYASFRGDMPELYEFIRQEVPEDAVVAYAKPRALYVFTGRTGFVKGLNGHILADADYFADTYMPSTPREPSHTEERDGCLIEPLRATQYWTLYKVTKIQN